MFGVTMLNYILVFLFSFQKYYLILEIGNLYENVLIILELPYKEYKYMLGESGFLILNA